MIQKSIRIAVGICGTIAVIAATAGIVWFAARNSFAERAHSDMSSYIRLKSLEFEANMNEQLTLVRQMVKTPSIVSYLTDPTDESVKRQAFDDFLAFQNSFLSKSVFWTSDANLEFWSGMEYAYTVNPDDPNDYWYNMTLYETGEYNFNINFNEALNATFVWVNAVVPGRSGAPVGMAGTGIPLTNFIQMVYDGLDSDKTMYLYNDAMEITGAKDESILRDKLNITSRIPLLGSIGAKPAGITFVSRPEGEYLLAPLSLVGWHVVLFTPLTMRAFWSNAVQPLVICVAIVIVVLALVLAMINIISQLSVLKTAVDELSSGNADLTKRISLPSRSLFKIFDELVDSVNHFVIKLQEIVREVKKANGTLDATGHFLKDCTVHTTDSLGKIIANVERMEKDIALQVHSVDQTANTVNAISSNIESLGTIIDTQTVSVGRASSVVGEMVSNIDQVNTSVTSLSLSFSGLQDKTAQGVSKQEEVNSRILKIREQSQMLESANAVISSIAAQTNLLAMNAAIEAAHAGEAGKGFSVVADEIRKLSENSSTQSKTIGTQLSDIQTAMSEIVNVSQASRTMLNALSQDIGETNTLVQQIAAAMQEQKSGSEQINQSLSDLNRNSEEVKRASTEMTQGNRAILEEMKQLERATSSMKDGMNEMVTGTRQITKTSSELSELAGRLDVSIDGIGAQLDQFKA